MWNRRTFLKSLAATSALSSTTQLAFARGSVGDERLCLIFLRGGLDGLHMVVPYDDPDYYSQRGRMALGKPGDEQGVVDLDGSYGLHPSLASLLPHFERGDLGMVHGVGAPLRTRSHFDAQEVIENGTDRPGGARDGWLNRALHTELDAMGIGATLPLLLRGPRSVTCVDPLSRRSAAPSFLDRVHHLYSDAPRLQATLNAGRSGRDMVQARRQMTPATPGKRQFGAAAFTGHLLAAEDGPRVAVMEVGGWDTHTRQAGTLAALFEGLAVGLSTMAEAMHPVWDKTVICVFSEFGRTVIPNGTEGTDHGSAGTALLLGGAVRGGMHGRYPGLSDAALLERRDLFPTTDVRAIFKGILASHLGLEASRIEDVIFPNSIATKPIYTLIS